MTTTQTQAVHGAGCAQGSYGEWLLYWLENFRRPGDVVKETSYANYHTLARLYLLPGLGAAPLAELSVQRLQEFFFELRRAGGRGGEGLSVKLVHDVFSLVNLSLRQALVYGRIAANPCERVVLPVLAPREMRVLSMGEQARLERCLARQQDARAAGVWLSLYAGLRVGEVAALTWDCVDLERRQLWVRATLMRIREAAPAPGQARTRIVVGEPKTAHSKRSIPLPQTLCAVLEALRQSLPGKLRGPGQFVVAQREKGGKFYEPRLLEWYFEQLAVQAGLGQVNYHCLRHTFATRAYELGMDAKTLSEVLGHARLETTMRRYVHTLDEHKAAAMYLLDRRPWQADPPQSCAGALCAAVSGAAKPGLPR